LNYLTIYNNLKQYLQGNADDGFDPGPLDHQPAVPDADRLEHPSGDDDELADL
jgi:hypothetical protein